MRSFSPAVLFFAASFLTVFTSGAAAQQPDYSDLLISLLNGYQKVMTADLSDSPGDTSGAAWELIAETVRQGFLRFTIDPMNEGIVDGARFYASPEEEVARIYLSFPLLEFSQERPGTAYGILTRAIAEAAAFFGSPDLWWNAQNDALDRFVLTKASYRLQAEMIRNRLVSAELDPGLLGNFVLKSFENDGLTGTLLYLEGLSLSVSASLEEYRDTFRETGDADSLRTDLLALGKELTEARTNLPADAADSRVYPAAVAVHTWLELTPGLIAEIHRTDEDDNIDFGEIFSKESEYTALRSRMEIFRIKDMPLIYHIMENTRKGFELR